MTQGSQVGDKKRTYAIPFFFLIDLNLPLVSFLNGPKAFATGSLSY